LHYGKIVEGAVNSREKKKPVKVDKTTGIMRFKNSGGIALRKSGLPGRYLLVMFDSFLTFSHILNSISAELSP